VPYLTDLTDIDISERLFEWWWPATGFLFVAFGIDVIRYGR